MPSTSPIFSHRICRMRAWVASVVVLAACNQILGVGDIHNVVSDAAPRAADANSGLPDGTSSDASPLDATPAPCEQYCATIGGTCTGAVEQYSALASCLGSCAVFPPGAPGDTNGNSFACRSYHLQASESDPATHCQMAGPAGAGVCGTDCEGFCSIVMASCTGSHQEYASAADCLSKCAGFPDTAAYSTSVTGNTVACRVYVATRAFIDPATYCPRTNPLVDLQCP